MAKEYIFLKYAENAIRDGVHNSAEYGNGQANKSEDKRVLRNAFIGVFINGRIRRFVLVSNSFRHKEVLLRFDELWQFWQYS